MGGSSGLSHQTVKYDMFVPSCLSPSVRRSNFTASPSPHNICRGGRVLRLGRSRLTRSNAVRHVIVMSISLQPRMLPSKSFAIQSSRWRGTRRCEPRGTLLWRVPAKPTEIPSIMPFPCLSSTHPERDFGRPLSLLPCRSPFSFPLRDLSRAATTRNPLAAGP